MPLQKTCISIFPRLISQRQMAIQNINMLCEITVVFFSTTDFDDRETLLITRHIRQSHRQRQVFLMASVSAGTSLESLIGHAVLLLLLGSILPRFVHMSDDVRPDPRERWKVPNRRLKRADLHAGKRSEKATLKINCSSNVTKHE